jgi:hypothetical protein
MGNKNEDEKLVKNNINNDSDSYVDYIDISPSMITCDLIKQNNKIVISELQEIFKNIDAITIVGKGETAQYLDDMHAIGINHALIFTKHKYLFANDFESFFGIEHLFKHIEYIFFPIQMHIRLGTGTVDHNTIIKYLTKYKFNGKMLIYKLRSSRDLGQLAEYNFHQPDTTLTCVYFFNTFLNKKNFIFYGCYLSDNNHNDYLKLDYSDTKSEYLDDYIKRVEIYKNKGRQNVLMYLIELGVNYVLN